MDLFDLEEGRSDSERSDMDQVLPQKGKGQLDETITIDDDEEEDSIKVTGIKRRAEIIESDGEE
jgi:hypothetical protein